MESTSTNESQTCSCSLLLQLFYKIKNKSSRHALGSTVRHCHMPSRNLPGDNQQMVRAMQSHGVYVVIGTCNTALARSQTFLITVRCVRIPFATTIVPAGLRVHVMVIRIRILKILLRRDWVVATIHATRRCIRGKHDPAGANMTINA